MGYAGNPLLFFFAIGAFIWRTQSEEFWVNFKVFGFLPLIIVFTLTIPLIMMAVLIAKTAGIFAPRFCCEFYSRQALSDRMRGQHPHKRGVPDFENQAVRHAGALDRDLIYWFVITAALALLANNKIIFYMKPTIVNILFGVAAIVGVLMGKNIIRLMRKKRKSGIGSAFTLPDRIWDMLAIRWGLFFFAMAVLNEFIWRTQSEEFWVNLISAQARRCSVSCR